MITGILVLGWAAVWGQMSIGSARIEQYIEKELFVAKWGSGENEFKQMASDTIDTPEGKVNIYFDAERMRVGKENIYVKNKYDMFIISKEGNFLKKLQLKPYDDFDVNEDGNIYCYDDYGQYYLDDWNLGVIEKDSWQWPKFDLIYKFDFNGKAIERFKFPRNRNKDLILDMSYEVGEICFIVNEDI